jgi:hypothetical protein
MSDTPSNAAPLTAPSTVIYRSVRPQAFRLDNFADLAFCAEQQGGRWRARGCLRSPETRTQIVPGPGVCAVARLTCAPRDC